MNPIQESLDRLQRGVLATVKNTMQKAPIELSVYVHEFMDNTTKPDSSGKGKTKKRFFKDRNRGDKVRTLTTKLGSAMVPGQYGNVTKTEVNGGVISTEVGVDTTKIKHAMIHEHGGTIKHPGGTLYKMGANSKAIFLANNSPDADSAIGRTKPHDITIKARPYMKPGMELFMKDAQGFPALMQELEDDLIELFNA